MSEAAAVEIGIEQCRDDREHQRRVDNDFIRLPGIGIHGNSHYLMLEKNSMEIAGVVADWLARRVTPAEAKEATTGR